MQAWAVRNGRWRESKVSRIYIKQSFMALTSADDLSRVYTLLRDALSQDESVRKPAEATLAACENRPGFCSCLLVRMFEVNSLINFHAKNCWVFFFWFLEHNCAWSPQALFRHPLLDLHWTLGVDSASGRTLFVIVTSKFLLDAVLLILLEAREPTGGVDLPNVYNHEFDIFLFSWLF